MFADITSMAELESPPSSDAQSKSIAEGSATVHGQIRDAARSIEDRIRRVLVPPGSQITTLRFLVVDDHLDSADALAAVMELIGCQVRASYDAASAMLVAAEFNPQVCLLDLKMPGMNGFELAGHLKAQVGSGARLLIATTALGDEESRKQSQAAGFHLHLVKPVDVPSLIDAITRLWEIVQEQAAANT
jgi:CheY-like chemotaxis protein